MDFWHLRLSGLSHGRLYALVHPLWKWILEGWRGIRVVSQVLLLKQVFGHFSGCDCRPFKNNANVVDPPTFSPFLSPFLCLSKSISPTLSLPCRFHNDDRIWSGSNLKTIFIPDWTIIFIFITAIVVCICIDCGTYFTLKHGQKKICYSDWLMGVH